MKMAKLITEYSQDFQITEDKNKDMYVVGIFSSAEIENNNKRKYRKEILEREINKVNEKVEKKCLWGELGHPPNPEVNPDKIALRTVSLEWKGTNLYGKAKLLDTPMGQIAKTLVKEGAMGISSRGLGTVGEDGYVNEDFHLITWDLVTDPSNKPSWVNGIYEGQDFNIPGTNLKKDPTEDEIREAQKVHYRQLLAMIEGLGKELEVKESDLGRKVNQPFDLQMRTGGRWFVTYEYERNLAYIVANFKKGAKLFEADIKTMLKELDTIQKMLK